MDPSQNNTYGAGLSKFLEILHDRAMLASLFMLHAWHCAQVTSVGRTHSIFSRRLRHIGHFELWHAYVSIHSVTRPEESQAYVKRIGWTAILRVLVSWTVK
jgi:hypothetical protein